MSAPAIACIRSILSSRQSNQASISAPFIRRSSVALAACPSDSASLTQRIAQCSTTPIDGQLTAAKTRPERAGKTGILARRVQPGREFGGSKRKQMTHKRQQICFLLFPFISFYFPESGLFNGLRAIEIRKIRPPLWFALKLSFGPFQTAAASPRPLPPAVRRFRK